MVLESMTAGMAKMKVQYLIRLRGLKISKLPEGFGQFPGNIDVTDTSIDQKAYPALQKKFSTESAKDAQGGSGD